MLDMPWREAIIAVMSDSTGAMHYTDVAERIVSRGLRESVGATPASTVNATITTSINTDGEYSPFSRVGRGEYILRRVLTGPPSDAVAAPRVSEEEEPDVLAGPIHALGMFWSRESVHWRSSPRILGRQQIGADPVDMAQQRGIYLLHDVREVIYVGRSVDRPLGVRLYEHTADRLRSRWDRFSWFGLSPIREDGTLAEPTRGHRPDQVIASMEAMLIEALEPGQNRRRGDGFTGVEFIQAEDPELERAQRREILAELQRLI